MTEPTSYPHVNDLLSDIVSEMRAVLGDKLVGLYLYGSLVKGDFDTATSDVDLLAAISDDLTDEEFRALEQMHYRFVEKRPEWNDRIEIVYYSLEGLRTFKTQRSPIAVISPGEPFNIKDAGIDWLMNWYFVQTDGVALYGPPPKTIIEPVSIDEFLASVKEQMGAWREYFEHVYERGSQAYAILTMCRGLYTLAHGEQVSKPEAARWAMDELPEWAWLIQNALEWRKVMRDPTLNVDPEATLPDTRRFVYYAIDRGLNK